MNAVDIGGKLEVTSMAVGVAVVTQRTSETTSSTIVESAQVGDDNSQPLKGGVHKGDALLVGVARQTMEKAATPYQQLPAPVDNLGAAGGETENPRLTLTTIPAGESRPSTPAEILDLPAQARLGLLNRRTVVDANLLEKICLLLSFGYSNRQAASYLGISPQTITNISQRCPELAADFQLARDRKNMVPELTILAEATKNWRAAAWYLTHLAKAERPLTEEEKEERHQAKLADQRRSSEITQQMLRDFGVASRTHQEEEAKGRNSPPVFAAITREQVKDEVRRKKKVRGK